MALTHRHAWSLSACGIYVNVATKLLDGLNLQKAIRVGTKEALEWYDFHSTGHLMYVWNRMRDMDAFAQLPESEISSHGIAMATLEAALWCLLSTDNYRDCVVKAVNLGHDADTTAAVAGGLAGLYYGYDAIPADWVADLLNKGLIDDVCRRFADFTNCRT